MTSGKPKKSFWQMTPKERNAAGVCTMCTKHPPAPNRKLCPDCLRKARAAWHKKADARKAKGLCVRCGKQPARPERTECVDCAARTNANYDGKKGRSNAYLRYWSRVAAGLCVKCGKAPPEPDHRTCPTCAEKYRARDRLVSKERKAKGLCTSCGKPSNGAWLCPSCAEKMRHYKTRYATLPVWSASYSVYDRLTGEPLGSFDSREDVALHLAFAKLDRDQVEIVTEAPLFAAYAGMG